MRAGPGGAPGSPGTAGRALVPPRPPGGQPAPFPRVRGGVPGAAARGARTGLRGASSKQTLPAPPGAQLPGPGRAGRGRSEPGTQPAARPGAARRLTSLPPPATWSGPAPRRLGAARQPAHRHMRAPERAARTLERAPPRAPPPSPAHRGPDAPGIGAGARDAGALFPAALYLVVRRGLGSGGGAYGTGHAPDPPPPRPPPDPRPTGGGGRGSVPPAARFPGPPARRGCTLGGAGQAAS